MMKDKIPNGWFPMTTCPYYVFVALKTGNEEESEYSIGYLLKDNIAYSTWKNDITYKADYELLCWQPCDKTPAFGPWIDGPPTIDTGLMYRVVLLDEKEYYGRYDVLLNEWDLKENNLWGQLSVDADRIIKLCRAIGAVEGVG